MRPLTPKTIPPERVWTWIADAARLMFECPIPTLAASLPMLILAALVINLGINTLMALVFLTPATHFLWWRCTRAVFALTKRTVVARDVLAAAISFSMTQFIVFAIIAIILAVIGLPIHDAPVIATTALMLAAVTTGSWIAMGYAMVWSLIANGVGVMQAVVLNNTADSMNRPVFRRLWIVVMVAGMVPFVNIVAAMLVPYIGFVAFRDIFLDVETDAEQPTTGSLVSA